MWESTAVACKVMDECREVSEVSGLDICLTVFGRLLYLV